MYYLLTLFDLRKKNLKKINFNFVVLLILIINMKIYIRFFINAKFFHLLIYALLLRIILFIDFFLRIIVFCNRFI